MEKYQTQIMVVVASVSVAGLVILKLIMKEINESLSNLENGLGEVNLRLLEEVEVLKNKVSVLTGESLKDHLALCNNLDMFNENNGLGDDDDDDNGEMNGHTSGWIARFISGLFVIMTVTFLIALRSHMDMIASLIMKHPEGAGENKDDIKWSAMLAYRVDYIFSTTPSAKAIALGCSTIAMLIIGCFSLFAVSSQSLSDTLWATLGGLGIESSLYDDTGSVLERIISIFISLGGVLVTAMLLGLISDAIGEYMDGLREGRSDVMESDHTLILGRSDKLMEVIRQLSLANESEGGGVVVVLNETGKEEVEQEIAAMEVELEGGLRGTTVVVRKGSPMLTSDLRKVSSRTARSVLVLGEGSPQESDARAMRVVLGLVNGQECPSGHIVVEVADVDADHLIKLVGGDQTETIVAHELLGRLMIQCARQPGLSAVWESLLGFEGAEFYLKTWDENLPGMSFLDASFLFADAIPLGVRKASDNMLYLNPPNTFIFEVGDELLVLAEDDDTYSPLETPSLPSLTSKGPIRSPRPQAPERVLFIGWRRDMDALILALNSWVASGSEVWIFAELTKEEREKRFIEEDFDPLKADNLTIMHTVGDPKVRKHVNRLPLETFSSVLVLAEEETEGNTLHADSNSLATLLLVRDLQTERKEKNDEREELFPTPVRRRSTSYVRPVLQRPSEIYQVGSGIVFDSVDRCTVVAEVLDGRTKALMSSSLSDPVLSNDIVSMALSMVAENMTVNDILTYVAPRKERQRKMFFFKTTKQIY